MPESQASSVFTATTVFCGAAGCHHLTERQRIASGVRIDGFTWDRKPSVDTHAIWLAARKKNWDGSFSQGTLNGEVFTLYLQVHFPAGDKYQCLLCNH